MNEIIQDLRNGATIHDTCKKYNIQFKDLFKLLYGHPQQQYKPKCEVSNNIYKQNHRYTIKKRINNEIIQFGTYFNLNEAIENRNRLEKLNWQADPMDYLGDMFLSRRGKRYVIQKESSRSKTLYYGLYHTLEDARKVRDCLVKLNWDKDYLPLILRRLGVERIGGN